MTILNGDNGSKCILIHDSATYDEWLDIYPDGKIIFDRHNYYSKRGNDSWQITIENIRNDYPYYYNTVTRILQQFNKEQ